MAFAKLKLIDGDYYRLYGIIITSGRADIHRAKSIVATLRKAGKQVRRERNVVYVRARCEK